jgi:hypothetical protein
MTFDEFNQLLVDNSGVTTRALFNIIATKPLPTKSFFFQPYESNLDPLCRVSSIVTDSLVLSFLALQLGIVSAIHALKSLVDLICLDPQEAKDDIILSGQLLGSMFVMIFAAALSSIINTIDLIVSGVATLSQDSSEEDFGYTP